MKTSRSRTIGYRGDQTRPIPWPQNSRCLHDKGSGGTILRQRSPASISARCRGDQFQFALMVIDLAIIAFFLAGPYLRDRPSYLIIDVIAF
jgi:hypothetical protein